MSAAFCFFFTHLLYTKAHSMLGVQIAYTVGHSARGTLELMNYHLLHVKCHWRFVQIVRDSFPSIFFPFHCGIIISYLTSGNEH